MEGRLIYVLRLDDGADHAGAQVALLIWWDVVVFHDCKCSSELVVEFERGGVDGD